ncbi:MAG: phospholipase D-like domain-containing protein [Deferribacterales bacterium]
MRSGRGYRKFSAKLIGILTVLAAFFIYSNLKADIREHEATVAVLPDKSMLQSLVHDIANAKESVYMAIYMFKTSDRNYTDTEMIKQALIKAAQNGVKIYVVMDDAGKSDITTAANKDTGEELKKAGIKVVYDDKKVRLHAKTTVIDHNITYIGSHNYTVSAINYNREVTVRIVSGGVAEDTISFITSVK